MDWLLITWVTHGSWLPGDPRGFRTGNARKYVPPPARYAKENEEPYKSSDYSRLYRHFSEKTKCVLLNDDNYNVVLDVAREITGPVISEPAYVSVMPDHVHLLLPCDNVSISKFVQKIKGRSSRFLSDHGLKGSVWAKKYHVRRIPVNGRSGAVKYVMSHGEKGMALKILPAD